MDRWNWPKNWLKILMYIFIICSIILTVPQKDKDVHSGISYNNDQDKFSSAWQIVSSRCSPKCSRIAITCHKQLCYSYRHFLVKFHQFWLTGYKAIGVEMWEFVSILVFLLCSMYAYLFITVEYLCHFYGILTAGIYRVPVPLYQLSHF